MRDKELRNLTVGSLLFGALKFFIISSPKNFIAVISRWNLALSLDVLDMKPRHVPMSDFTLPILLRQNRRNMEKSKNQNKYLVRDGIEQITLQTDPKYAFFWLRCLMIGFTVTFILKRLSSNVWCGLSGNTSSRPMSWQSLGIVDFFHFAHLLPPGEISGLPLLNLPSWRKTSWSVPDFFTLNKPKLLLTMVLRPVHRRIHWQNPCT